MRTKYVAGLIVAAGVSISGVDGSLTARADDFPGQMSHLCNLDENPLEAPGSGLLGIFDGAWGDKLPHTVIIYKVKRTKVRLYYAIGVYEPWNIKEPDCYKVKGKLVDDGSVSFHFSGSKADVVYRIDNEGERLYGTYTRGGNVTRGTFKRVY